MSDARIDGLVREATRLRYSRRGVLKRATALGLSAPAVAAALARTPHAAAATRRRAQPVTLNWFAARDTTGFSVTQVEAFNAQNPNIQISYQEQGATTVDLHDKFVTVATAGDSSVDIVSMDVPFVPEFAAAGWTQPAEELLPAAERAAYFPGTLEGATYAGTLSAAPWYNNGGALFYRKDLLEGAGLQPPRTYEELQTQAGQLQTPEIAGYIFQAAQAEGGVINFLEYLWGHGGDVLDETGENVLVGEGPGLEALQRMLGYVYTAKISPESTLTLTSGADAQNIFVEGRAVFLRAWIESAGVLDAETSAVKGLWDVAPLPSKDGAQAGPGCLGTWNLGISAASANAEAAAEAIRFLTSEEQQTARLLGSGRLPTRAAVLDNPEVNTKYPYLAKLRPAFDALKPRPVTPFYSQISSEALQPNFGEAMTRNKEPEQAIADMASGIEAVLAQ